ncbi:ribosomal protection-like ABC-F family protein [uncultured Alistipes sp.]|uniref:ribosomal protection-like ABC-F family protein n=2 Tax=Alistipes TaxID=239759 RepID=UPI00261A3E1D|nr:ABC-F family ATP-binding cassette domain-containing protein [uncultured Alistipes sp.]
MISLDNLTVSYGGWTLFDNISFLINPKDRIGLVGKNGAGKTTLLRIITGEQQPTSGAVTINGECTIGYLPQTMRVADTTTLVDETAKAFDEVLRLEAEIADLTREITVRTDYESAAYEQLLHRLNDAQDRYHILGGETRDADIEKTLLGLGFKREDFGRATSEFSGGWRMRIELAKLLLRRPSIFLLDEPTNHLDIESIQWLEEYLKNYNGAVLLISHDRAFLDNVTNRTVELSLGRITDYKVPYSKYVVLRAERRAQQLAAYENQQRMIEKTEEFIEKFRYKPTKSNQVQSRIKQLERLERLEVEEEDLATLNIKFPPAPRSGQIVAEINEAGMSFGAKHVFSGANFVIEKGDRIALVGRNGEGKTTLARMLVGQLTPTEGSIRIGANVNIGYYAQNQDDLMDGEFTVYDTLDRVAVGDIRTRLRDILGAFLFRGEDIDKKVKVLSGGERARLAMARMMLEPRNLLVLDEPTNHMDMRSKDILKNAILKYDGTVVVVSHDREFLDGMVEKVYEFRDGGVKEYLGGIYYFLEKRKLESLQEIERRDAPAKTAAPKSAPKAGPAAGAKGSDGAKGSGGTTAANAADGAAEKAALSGKASYEQKKEQEKLLRKLRKAVESVETELAELEKRIAEYDAKFAAATDYNEADYTAYNDLKSRYDHQMHEWEKASYELEITEEQYNG